jgi:transcription initiation factor TFIIIB Brf1 subunit/transcription initiation factor TFIIB
MMNNKKEEEGYRHKEVTILHGEIVCKRCGRILTDEIAVLAFK